MKIDKLRLLLSTPTLKTDGLFEVLLWMGARKRFLVQGPSHLNFQASAITALSPLLPHVQVTIMNTGLVMCALLKDADNFFYTVSHSNTHVHQPLNTGTQD